MAISTHILKYVWGLQKEGYVFIPRKRAGKKSLWEEGRGFSFPEEWEEIKAHIAYSTMEAWDVYFCPLLFSFARRIKEHVLPTTQLLWADLDKVTISNSAIKPSIMWKSSDEKYQCLWLLDKEYPIEEIESLNKALTYALGADKGGWDITQVLRIPGSINYKYNPPQKGELLWAEKNFYTLPEIKNHIMTKEPVSISLPHTNILSSLLEKYTIPQRAVALLEAAEAPVGERSDRLWELEILLIEAGLPLLDVIALIKASVWNKFRGRHDEEKYLYQDVLKAEAYVKAKEPVFKVETVESIMEKTTWAVPFSSFMTTPIPPPAWLIEHIWQAGTYGMVAGEPKTYKSVTVLDMAMSVASGRAFLGRYAVKQRGAVMYVQEENSAQTIQDRVQKIASYKKISTQSSTGGSFLDDLPIFFSNNFGINLTDTKSRILLEQTILNVQPILLILDPLYMMLGSANENDATEMRGILQWLTLLRNRYNLSIVVVHHYNKNNQSYSRGGTKIRGTSSFHGWVESSLYIKHTTIFNEIEIEREFRSFPAQPPFTLSYDLGEPGETYYLPRVAFQDSAVSIGELHREKVFDAIRRGVTDYDVIQEICGISRAKLSFHLKELLHAGLIEYVEGRGRGFKSKFCVREERKDDPSTDKDISI